MYSLKDLTEEQKKLLPTREDVSFYQENGWYVSKKIIPDNLLDEAVVGAKGFYNGNIDFKLKNKVGIANDILDSSSA